MLRIPTKHSEVFAKFDAFIKQGVAVTDGGTGTTLQLHGYDLNQLQGLWSSGAPIKAPHLVKAVHRDFINAGANLVMTASFRSKPTDFEAAGLPAEDSLSASRKAVQLALESARTSSGILVAASISPIKDCYSGETPSDEIMKNIHDHQARVMANAGAHLIISETVGAKIEAEYMQSANAKTGLPFIISCTVDDTGKLPDGSSLAEVEEATRHPNRVAFGVNCSKLGPATEAVHQLLESGYKDTVIFYPNNFTAKEGPGEGLSWIFGDDKVRAAAATNFVDISMRVVEKIRANGNRVIVGGCCGTTPVEISALAKRAAADHGYRSAALEITAHAAKPQDRTFHAHLHGRCCPHHKAVG